MLDGSIPMGGAISNCFGATPLDILHGWCAGIVKYVLHISLCILLVVSGDNYVNTFSVIEERMARIPRFPSAPGFAKTKFNHGICL